MKKSEIPARYRWRVKHRQIVMAYAETHSLRATAKHFGLHRKTVRRWHAAWRAGGVAGLIPRYANQRPRRISPEVVAWITEARRDQHFGAAGTRVWLLRVHGVAVNTTTIRHSARSGCPTSPSPTRRRLKQLRLFEKEQPGDSVQVDVTAIRLKRERVFQYTAIDDCTRFRVLRLYPRLNQHSSTHFFGEVRRALPFPIRRVQTDHGTEFPLAFRLTVEAAGCGYRYIRPRRPQQNGKVERSHRIDDEDFWQHHDFARLADAESALHAWEHTYNYQRFSMALGGLTPAEKLHAKLASAGPDGLGRP
jgi:transposase InsO family protein